VAIAATSILAFTLPSCLRSVGKSLNQVTSRSHSAHFARVLIHPDQKFGWTYGGSLQEAEANVERALLEWERQARPFFQAHSYPSGLTRMLEGLLVAEVHPSHLLTFARIATQLGQRQRALEIARSALERVPPAASGLRYALNAFLAHAAT
jgi:hypothetical protein